jgi:hypothetical protein
MRARASLVAGRAASNDATAEPFRASRVFHFCSVRIEKDSKLMLYVDLPTRSELETLATTRAETCVSIYLPTHPVTQHMDVDRLEFRALAELAVAQLRERDAPSDRGHATAFEQQFRRLAEDGIFWRYQSTSLAVLATPDRCLTYRLPSRLQRMSEVSDRFHLRPLIGALSFPSVAFVLAFSQKTARLIEVGPDHPGKEVEVADLPTGIAELARTAGDDPEAPALMPGGQAHKTLIEKYARSIDRAVSRVVAAAQAPLILACVDYLSPIYRSIDSSQTLLDETIYGNPDQVSPRELGERALDIVRRHEAQRLEEIRERHGRWRTIGRASSNLADVARAATAGAVDTLLFDIDGATYGHISEDTGVIQLAREPSASSYDIVDEAIGRTILTGGAVLGVRRADLPDAASPVAALLRFPV